MFFEKFEELCSQKGVTPTHVSTEIGISKGSVSYWKKKYKEGVDAKPDLNTAQKIAEYFGVSMDVLLDRTTMSLEQIIAEAQAARKPSTLNDSGFIPFEQPLSLNEKEREVIEAYRHNPEAQIFVDRLLGIAKNEEES